MFQNLTTKFFSLLQICKPFSILLIIYLQFPTMSTDEKNQCMVEQDVLKNLNAGNIKSQGIFVDGIKALKQNLYKAKQKLSEFVSKLGEIKNRPLRDDVLEHCDNIKVKVVVNKYLPYEKVEKLIQNRIQNRMLKNKKIKHNWSQEDIFILLWVLSKYLDYHQIKNIENGLDYKIWPNISQMIPGIQNSDDCKFKWLSLRNNKLTQNYWLDIQSIQLDRIVRQNGGEDWQEISKTLYDSLKIPNKVFRCAKQCREHWNCYLNPKLKKGPWSKNQDFMLLSCVQKNNGLRKWTEIVTHLEGRTENALKNRFQLLIKKQRQTNKQIKQLSEFELVKFLTSKLYKEINGIQKDQSNSVHINLQQNLKKSITSTPTNTKERTEKKNKKNKKKSQRKQEPQLYQPPRKRKEIKKREKPYLRNCTDKFKKFSGIPIKQQHNIQKRNTRGLFEISKQIQSDLPSSMSSMDEQFKIEASKQYSNIQAKFDMIESGSALQLSQISPFKPYCINNSQKKLEKQLRFEEGSQLKNQTILESFDSHKNILNTYGNNIEDKEAQDQNQRQASNFKQFQVQQMNSQRLIQHILSKCSQINIGQYLPDEGKDQGNDNEKESNVTTRMNNNFCAIVIKDQRLKFLPCILEKNSQKLIPFHFKEKNQSNQ